MELSATFAALVPTVMALVSAAKGIGLDSKYAPIVAVVLGAIGVYLTGSHEIAEVVMQGFLIGLTASGLYSGVKTSANIVS